MYSVKQTAGMRWVLLFLLACLEILLGAWVRLPVGVWLGGGLAAAALVFRSIANRRQAATLAALWVGSLIAWAGAVRAGVTADTYYSFMAGLMAAAVWLASREGVEETWRARWNAPVAAWLLCGALSWLASGYMWNKSGVFYAGLLATLAVLALCRWWFRCGALGRQFLNTLILLVVGLPITDLVRRPQSRIAARPETCRLYYSYDAAKGDPDAFHTWVQYYNSQFDRLGHDIFMPDPESKCPVLLRPGSHGMFVGCPVSVNSLGFEGAEFSAAKHDAYRIVALGESSTFGMTIQPGELPWPEMLGQIIRQRLQPRRPVQVINAGVPAYTIYNSIDRLSRNVLALQPDMIISYHGANGFSMLSKAVLPATGRVPPVYQERPIKLAADVEHRLRMLAFQYHARLENSFVPAPSARPLDTAYAAAYRQLIGLAATNRIRLALANFSMAVNAQSDPRVIDFYQGGGARAAYGFISANAIHTQLLNQLATEHPEVRFIDTHPHLDGEHEKFIDLIHLSNEGRQQLAENIFQGIRKTLETDLAQP